jgi:hypothetical protein
MMTKHKLTAIDLFIIQDTIYHSLNVLNYGGTTKKAREETLHKILDIMDSMNVEILTDTPEPTTTSTDTDI